MSLLDVENITHSYGDKPLFLDVSFRLFAGEHVGLVGVNGAGKSTLLRLLTGEALPDQGRIKWLSGVKFGYLEQHMDLKEGHSVRDYLRSAFADLFEIEQEWIDVSQRMSATSNPDELEALFSRYVSLQELLERKDFYLIDAKVEDVANGLGLSVVGLDKDVCQLSGGQRTKLLLAKLLLEKPDVLLLDEPTNHLDTDHIVWLTGYLKNYPKAFILVSHDTEFMNEVVGIIYHLEYQRFYRYVGNYNHFLSACEARKNQVLQAYSSQQREIKKQEEFIQKNKARASTSKRAKSREKMLAKMERIDKPVDLPRPRFAFRVAMEPPQILVKATGIQAGYSYPLFPPIDLTIKRGDKIALIGCNGIGKSTLLKSLLRIHPVLSGQVVWGDQVKPAYFSQEGNLDGEDTPLEAIWKEFSHLTQKEVRNALAMCGLRARHVASPISTLSGGEQSRVRLCKLILTKSNWLVLDEPTNHLDVVAKEVLRDALKAFKGTILLVSHEASFHQDWVTEIWDVEKWV